MKVISIMLFRQAEKGPLNKSDALVMLSSTFNLQSFGYFQRGSIQEMCTFFGRTFAINVEPGQRKSVTHEDYLAHLYAAGCGVTACLFADIEYPERVAHNLLTQAINDYVAAWQGKDFLGTQTEDNAFRFDGLEALCIKCQNPAEADKITKIQQDLSEVKNIMHQTIDSMLERGEKLDSLMEKSNDLSGSSKMFFKTAKKQNACCKLM